MEKLKIQKGFIGGIAAVAVLAILSGLVLRFSSISASTETTSSSSSCVSGATVSAIPPTDEEKKIFGDNVKVYITKTRQNKTFKVLLGVKEQSKIGGGGIVSFTAGLQNLNNFVYTEKKGRVVVRLKQTGGNKASQVSAMDFYYGNPSLPLGKYWYKTQERFILNYSNVSVSLELRNGSGYYLQSCIANALDLNQTLNPTTPTPTPTPTPSSTATATATSTQTSTPAPEGYDISLKHGFNAIVIPDSVKPVLTQKLKDAGMTVFAFNVTGDKAWNRTIGDFHPWQGYYVLNEGDERTIKVDLAPSNYQYYKSIAPGWNLLANSSGEAVKLSDLKYDSYSTIQQNTGNAVSCATGGDNMDGAGCVKINPVSLSDLIKNGKGHTKIYVVKDSYATTAADAFQIIQVDNSNVDSVTIPAGKPFWFYLWQ